MGAALRALTPGQDVGFFAIPPVDASVWVEFEGGERDHPIWTGCFWEAGEIAAADATPDIAFFRTPGGDDPDRSVGHVEIETTGGAKITLTGTEITLEAPTIKHGAMAASAELERVGLRRDERRAEGRVRRARGASVSVLAPASPPRASPAHREDHRQHARHMRRPVRSV